MTTGIYGRISLDRSGEAPGANLQIKLGHELCDRMAFADRRDYMDNDLSATQGGPRPDYARLLADVEAGIIKQIVVFHLSRLWRNRRERAEGIELLKKHSVSVICVKGPHLDMSTAYGRGAAGMLGEVDTMEVEIKSERQIAANYERAMAGLPHPGGPRAFGFEPDGITIRPAEVAAIQEAYRMILAGGSLRAIARAWNEAGLYTGKKRRSTTPIANYKRQGDPEGWLSESVRDVLMNPRYAKIRTYKHPDGTVEEFPAVWPEVVTEQTYRAAVAKLSDPERAPAPAVGSTLLGTVALCGVCDATVHSGGGRRPDAARRYHAYRCSAFSGRHIVRKAEPIEDLVVRLVIARLSASDAIDLLIDHSKPDVPALIAEREGIRRRQIELAEDFAKEFDPAQMRAANRALKDRLDKVNEQIADAGRLSALGPLIDAEDVSAAWDGLDLDSKRTVIRELMTVRILPVGQGVRTFRPESIDITWKV